MKVFRRFPTQHEDLIHDISYDFYGKRLATCSSDQKIQIWDLDEKSEWTRSAELVGAHNGSIWKLAWAHPEFGQILASCSFDRTVCIWEEEEDNEGRKSWQLKAKLVDSRDSVNDIKFAPRHMGLRLATCSADGFIRIYEAVDVMNLAGWPLMDEFEAHKEGASCISWNPSLFGAACLVVGTTNEHAIKIWEFNDALRKWQVGAVLEGHSAPVHDVSWAPNMGRSYHLIASASKDHTVRIWRVQTNEKQKFEHKQLACFDDHQSEVWRVEWNVTGTILASSGDDGTVRLWKPVSWTTEWKCVSIISGDDENDDF
eukprot:TRINITY_DN2819_c0_g1_i1.p1 TRINITY_DN2819_c0_g1~~TRINITY_DN2819_c0_g1_i1.p1  ORF type:complete len:314 (+),score=56.76 TRINITY_DN2819_c0_g1_i1:76-1017(+)